MLSQFKQHVTLKVIVIKLVTLRLAFITNRAKDRSRPYQSSGPQLCVLCPDPGVSVYCLSVRPCV